MDIKSDDGKRTTRRLGRDKVWAHRFFGDLLAELKENARDIEDSRVEDLLTEQLLPTQQRLRPREGGRFGTPKRSQEGDSCGFAALRRDSHLHCGYVAVAVECRLTLRTSRSTGDD